MVEGNVLVSKSIKLAHVQCVPSLKGVDFSKVSCLIFHSSEDTDIDTVMLLSEKAPTVSKLIYVNREISPVYFAVFTGLNADIYSDESFIEDADVFNFLISNYGNTQMTLKPVSSDLVTVQNLIDKVNSKSPTELQELFSNQLLVKTLSNALNNVETAVTRAGVLNTRLISMFSDARSLISDLINTHQNHKLELNKMLTMVDNLEKSQKEELEELRTELKEERDLRKSLEKYEEEVKKVKEEALALTKQITSLKEELEIKAKNQSKGDLEKENELEAYKVQVAALQAELEEEKKARAILESVSARETDLGVITYPTIAISASVPNVLHIQVHSPCRYLNSFILGFQNYLTSVARRSSKVLFVYPKLPLMTQKFAHLNTPQLAAQFVSLVGDDFRRNGHFVTFEPVKVVMDYFLGTPNVDLFIVVDYLYGEPIVHGTRLKRLYATGNASDITNYKLDPNRVITPLASSVETFLRIPNIKNYPTEPAQRLANYSSKVSDGYAKLTDFVFGGY